MKRIFIFTAYAAALILILGNCSDGPSNVVSATDNLEQADSPPLGPPEVPGGSTGVLFKGTSETSVTPGSDTDTYTYTFDDLSSSCSWDHILPGTYHDLVFLDTPYLAPCPFGSGMALVPTYHSNGTNRMDIIREIRIQLPAPGQLVSIISYKYRPTGINIQPTLIAYDASGTEIGRASSSASIGIMNTITVTAPADMTLDHIGLRSGQAINY